MLGTSFPACRNLYAAFQWVDLEVRDEIGLLSLCTFFCLPKTSNPFSFVGAGSDSPFHVPFCVYSKPSTLFPSWVQVMTPLLMYLFFAPKCTFLCLFKISNPFSVAGAGGDGRIRREDRERISALHPGRAPVHGARKIRRNVPRKVPGAGVRLFGLLDRWWRRVRNGWFFAFSLAKSCSKKFYGVLRARFKFAVR